MSGFIDKLYFDDFNIKEELSCESEYEKILRAKANNIESKILKYIPESEKELFFDFKNINRHLIENKKLEAFSLGFRKGVQCSFDVFDKS